MMNHKYFYQTGLILLLFLFGIELPSTSAQAGTIYVVFEFGIPEIATRYDPQVAQLQTETSRILAESLTAKIGIWKDQESTTQQYPRVRVFFKSSSEFPNDRAKTLLCLSLEEASGESPELRQAHFLWRIPRKKNFLQSGNFYG